jgi:hypothetical protein
MFTSPLVDAFLKLAPEVCSLFLAPLLFSVVSLDFLWVVRSSEFDLLSGQHVEFAVEHFFVERTKLAIEPMTMVGVRVPASMQCCPEMGQPCRSWNLISQHSSLADPAVQCLLPFCIPEKATCT